MAKNNEKEQAAETPQPDKPQDNLLIVDANQLAAVVAGAVAQAMKGAGPGSAGFDMAALGEVIGAAVASGIAKNTRRRMTYGEYEALGPRNAFHPKSKKETPQCTRAYWQNGTIMQHSNLFDREVLLLNRITHSGRYFDRLVEIVVDAANENVYINYNNKTPDLRFELKNHFRDLTELLTVVVRDQEREDREMRELEEERLLERKKREEARARHFGDNENTRAAYEQARQADA